MCLRSLVTPTKCSNTTATHRENTLYKLKENKRLGIVNPKMVTELVSCEHSYLYIPLCVS